jgi:hypothetical protein
MSRKVILAFLIPFSRQVCVRFLLWIRGIFLLIVTSGAAHYPINQHLKQADPRAGYQGINLIDPEK